MYKNKFDLLFEEIMKTTISVDTFDFEFHKLENDDIECKFDTADEDNQIIPVIAKINANGTFTFDIKINNITKTLNEKTFMLKYYKDYEKFKEAYADYLNEENSKKSEEFEKDNINNSEIHSDRKTIPGIKSFNSKLNSISTKNKGTTINKGNYSFIFRFLKDNVKNLIQANFDLINDEPLENELQKYNVISLIKLQEINTVPTKFILKDPENADVKEEWTANEFKERFPDTYKSFMSAINDFEKTQD